LYSPVILTGGNKMALTFNVLKDKEVISVTDGRRLGYIIDVEIDSCGKVTSIILPPPGKYFNIFSTKDNLRIPWECIERIGNDIVLVKNFELLCERKRNRE
jgi:YlmC/YmxH family sporulation protein